MVKKILSSKSSSSTNRIRAVKKITKTNSTNSLLKDKNNLLSKDDSSKKKKETLSKKKDDKHDLNCNKENINVKTKTLKKQLPSSTTILNESTTTNIKTTLENKPGTAPKRNCLSAASSSSYSSTSTSSSNSSNSTSESVKNLSPTQRAVHRKYCETVKLKNEKKQMEQQQDNQNNSNNNNLKLFFKDKVVMLNIGTLTGKYFQIEAFWTDTIADLKEIIQDKEGILKESQILIYQGKSLINDNYTLRDYNIQDGATLKLALQMSGGPGAVGNVKKKKTCDTVILLLCKRNNELLIFEINPNDDPSQSLIPKKVFQIDSNLNCQSQSNIVSENNKYPSNENKQDHSNKKINYMHHLNTMDQTKKNIQNANCKADGLSNNLLSPEIVQEIEKRAIASTLLGYNVTLAVQNLDNINDNAGYNSKKHDFNENNCNSVINQSESNLKCEYLDDNNHLMQNNVINTDDEYKSEEISISNINSTVINSIESKIQKHLFLDNDKENDTLFNENLNATVKDNDNDSLFHNFLHRPPSALGSCSNRSYDTSISFSSRPSSAESDSSLTSLIQECTAAAASFRETINKSQQFLNMYLNSEDDKPLESLEYRNKNFNYSLSSNCDPSNKTKKPFSPYLDIQELGTITISNNFANQTKYNYMPTIPSHSSYDNFSWDLPNSIPTTSLNTDEKKLSPRPSTAICITPIANSDIFPFMVVPKTRPSSAIEFSKSTKQYQMVLSNLWVNSKFHKKYLEKMKKNKLAYQQNKNLINEILDENSNKISDDFDQIPSEETSFILMNKKNNENENNELEDIEEDIQYDYISNDENKINILDDLEFNLTKKLNYFSINDANTNKNTTSLNTPTEKISLTPEIKNENKNVYNEDYTTNYNTIKTDKKIDKFNLNFELKEIPEVINTLENNNNDKPFSDNKLLNNTFTNNYYDVSNYKEDNKVKILKENTSELTSESIKKLNSDFLNNTSELKINHPFSNAKNNNINSNTKNNINNNIIINNENKINNLINKRNNVVNIGNNNDTNIVNHNNNSNKNNSNNNININHKNNKINSASVNSQNANTKCHVCNKKLGLMSGFKCKCGNTFCSIHRYSDSHKCTYDYKHQGKIQLTKNNPLFKNDKLVRI